MVPYNNSGRIFPPRVLVRVTLNLSLTFRHVFVLCRAQMSSFLFRNAVKVVGPGPRASNLTLTVNISSKQRAHQSGELTALVFPALSNKPLSQTRGTTLRFPELEKEQSQRPLWKAIYGLTNNQYTIPYAPLTTFRALDELYELT